MGTDPEQLFGAGMWSENAVRAKNRNAFVLEERHPDGHRWIAVRRFATKREAHAAMQALIAGGAARDRYRVERATS